MCPRLCVEGSIAPASRGAHSSLPPAPLSRLRFLSLAGLPSAALLSEPSCCRLFPALMASDFLPLLWLQALGCILVHNQVI